MVKTDLGVRRSGGVPCAAVSEMALLLGPPSSGKTTLLLALAGKLDPSLKVRGEITYKGHGLKEFVPQKTSAYIIQNDVHVGEMTMKETVDFSASVYIIDFCLWKWEKYVGLSEALASTMRRAHRNGYKEVTCHGPVGTGHHLGSDMCPILGTTKIKNFVHNIGALLVKLTHKQMAKLELIASINIVRG
ncbi:hypothetical protein LguiA_029730 [Lonicera macranthoides]